MAGLLGVSPGEWTLRRLEKAVKTKLTHDWDRSSLIAATLCNINRKPGSAPIEPARFNPYRSNGRAAASRGVPLTADNIGALKVFLQPTR